MCKKRKLNQKTVVWLVTQIQSLSLCLPRNPIIFNYIPNREDASLSSASLTFNGARGPSGRPKGSREMWGYKVVTNVPQVPVASHRLWFSRHSQWGSLMVAQGPLIMEGCCPHGYPRAPWTKEGTSQGSHLGDEISSLTTLPQQLAQRSHPSAGLGVSISGSRRRNR